jgi:hypothetical protein
VPPRLASADVRLPPHVKPLFNRGLKNPPRGLTAVQTDLVEAPPSQKGIPDTGGVSGSRPAGCRAQAPVRSRFAGKSEDAAACANRAGARHALGAQSRPYRGESNALLGWVGGHCGHRQKF